MAAFVWSALLAIMFAAIPIEKGLANSVHGEPPEPAKGKRAARILKRSATTSIDHQGADSLIDAWLARAELSQSLVGIDLMDLKSGQELFSFNGGKRFTPASTAKIFVTACAYETLGANFTYKTRFTSAGRIVGDKLDGDVLVEPCQDPTLSRADLNQMLNVLLARGIRSLSGKFILNDVQGGGERFLSEWLSEDWGQDWMPVNASLIVDRNISSPSFFSKAKLSLKGPMDTVNALDKTLLATECTPGWLSFEGDRRSISVYQSSEQAGSQALKVVANPDRYNLALINDMAEQNGIKVAGHNQSLTDPGRLTVLAEHESIPLSLIVKKTLKDSDNLYAEQILRTLGLGNRFGSNSKSTLTLEQQGLATVMAWLQSIGVAKAEVVLWDGCGLSRKNCVSARALNLVLRHMARQPATADYLGLLNQAKVSPKGSYQCKTGAMDSVRGIAGILQTAEGRQLALTILVNGHSPSVRDLRTSIGVLVSQLAAANLASLKKNELTSEKPAEQPKRSAKTRN